MQQVKKVLKRSMKQENTLGYSTHVNTRTQIYTHNTEHSLFLSLSLWPINKQNTENNWLLCWCQNFHIVLIIVATLFDCLTHIRSNMQTNAIFVILPWWYLITKRHFNSADNGHVAYVLWCLQFYLQIHRQWTKYTIWSKNINHL